MLSSLFCASTSLQMKQKSLSIHISSFNLGIFTFFLLSETTSCVDSQYEACVPKKCGGQNISYPFWIQGEQESYCGYPGFELTCQNNHSILQVPENNYTVQEIFYGNQSIRISVSNLSSECLPPIRNLSLEVDKFIFASSDIPYLHILSNCSLSLPGGLSDYNRISCGAKNEDVWGWGLALAMFGNNTNLSYALGKCKTQVLAPVELNAYDGIADYMKVLRRGFVLQWKASNCNECETSGGRCGFDASSYQFCCFCKDRPHRVSCKTKSVSYPYWQHEACRPKNCGTGFKVSCEAKKPVCWTSLSDYFTEDIFYQYNSFSLVNVQVINSRCPASLHDIAFDSSPFQFGPNFVDHYLFYNCSNLFPSNYSQYQITCASNATDNSFAYLDARTDGFTCSQFPLDLHWNGWGLVALPSVKTVVAIVGSTTAIVYAFAMMDLMANVAIMLIVHSTGQDDVHGYQHGCPQSFNCGKLGPVKFPFSNDTYPRCGLCTVNCSEPVPIIKLGWKRKPYEVKEFLNDEAVNVSDKLLGDLISSKSCDIFSNLSLFSGPSISYTISSNLTLFKCRTNSSSKPQLQTQLYSFSNCSGYTVYYTDPNQNTPTPANLSSGCVVIQLPMLPSIRNRNVSDLFSLLASEFTIGLHVSKECYECHHNGGQCHGHEEFHCIKDGVIAGRSHLKVVLATVNQNLTTPLLSLVIPGVILLLGLLAIRYRKKLNYVSSVVLSINTSSDPSSKPDLEGRSVYFGVPVFSYTELEEATNNFDPSKELGDGGFGTVYYGKLQDGREVAVKRLYEHNYKRVRQFMNEIEILTRLRHRNLVTLYGCTSRLSRELLLVYEYIPNGTVADHIHGDRAKDRPLVWSIRMSIAIETASALTYLHASDIIHRDVKTNNILLDNNFCVKVADFGLSRLFPNDVTHVSTAPQGTPGYVDPEYHQCYQLTDKSDVYSFGVVLIELISSMTAVDISRHRHEINLANLAINRIQHRAFNELIDPSLGFESDSSIERMTTMVAEVAFRCLQLEKEMRPTMEEVLRALKEIQDSKDENTGDVIENAEVLTSTRPPPSPEGDNIVLLKDGKELPSPDAVTDRWVSSSSTYISSG
ncbi:unnamed protein product [Camellia sinensis]